MPHAGKMRSKYTPLWKLPSCVQSCVEGRWHLRLWNEVTGEVKVAPYACKSFRCPNCGPKVARHDYFRIAEASKKKPVWAFMVITLKRSDFKNHTEAYLGLCRSFGMVRKRMQRKYGKVTYIRTVEEHTQFPFPHMNILFHCDGIFRENPTEEELMKWLNRWMKPQLVDCGFGYIATISYVASDNQKKVNEYMAKSSINSVSGELSKRSQIPLNAPKNFRRLGATAGLLPSRKSGSKDWKGCLIRSPLVNNPLTQEDTSLILMNS